MNRKGFALISVIIAFVIISLLALFVTNFISTESNLSIDKYDSLNAYYSSQAGVENAKYLLSREYNWFMLKEGLLESRNDNLGGSSYEAYIYLPATALRQNINKNKNSIPVVDTSRFPSTNILLLIDGEQIFCTAKTINSFNNCTRSYNGTTKSNHNVGAKVFSVATVSSVDLSSNTITVNNNDKFLTNGILLIDNDPSFSGTVYEVTYTDKDSNVFYGCDDLSWYSPGTYYVINKGETIDEQIEIRSVGNFKNFLRQIQITIYR